MSRSSRAPEAHQLPEPDAGPVGRRVEIVLDPDLYDRVRIKAMRQRKSLRSLGSELFAAWADDERASGTPETR